MRQGRWPARILRHRCGCLSPIEDQVHDGMAAARISSIVYTECPLTTEAVENMASGHGGAIFYQSRFLGRLKYSWFPTRAQQDCSLPLRYDVLAHLHPPRTFGRDRAAHYAAGDIIQ